MVNVLVHLLEPLTFRLRCPSFLLSKLCLTIKVSTICGAGRDTRNLCHKFSSQDLALRILGFRVICPKFQETSSRVLGFGYPVPGSQSPRVMVPRFSILGLRVPGIRVPGSKSQSSGSQGPRSQVLILDYINYKEMKKTSGLTKISMNRN